MPKKRRIIIVAGPNGAGKTTFAREYLLKEANCPDFVKFRQYTEVDFNGCQREVTMSRRVSSHSRETADISRALRRAAKRALELGIKTGTPVYVLKNNKIVDLTKDQRATKKTRSSSKSSSK